MVTRALTVRSGSRAGLETRLESLTGIRAGARIAESAVGGCTEAGCVLVVDGEYDGLSLERTAQGLSQATLRDGALSIGHTHGAPVFVRPLEEQRLLLGHAPALDALDADRTSRLDVQLFDGAIPAGDIWIAARDQELFAEQMRTWLQAQPTSSAADSLASLEDNLAQRPGWARGVDVIALSVSTAEPMRATLRLTCADEGTARRVQVALQAALAVGQQDDPIVEQALGEVVVYRWHDQVEALFVDTEQLAERVVERMETRR